MAHEQQMDGEAVATNSLVNAAGQIELRQDVERIASLAELGHDWDTYGGEPVSANAVARTTDLLRYLADAHGGSNYSAVRPRGIAPLASGGVNLEWRGPFGEMTIEVYPDGRLGCYTVEFCESQTTECDEEDPAMQTVIASLWRILGVQSRD